jgi:hypothetical protein
MPRSRLLLAATAGRERGWAEWAGYLVAGPLAGHELEEGGQRGHDGVNDHAVVGSPNLVGQLGGPLLGGGRTAQHKKERSRGRRASDRTFSLINHCARQARKVSLLTISSSGKGKKNRRARWAHLFSVPM